MPSLPHHVVPHHARPANLQLPRQLLHHQRHRIALQRWDPDQYKRVHVLTHADIGDSVAALGRADEAIDAWARALNLTDRVASDRARTAMMSTRPLLATYRRRGVPEAAELDHRIRDACR